MCSAYDSLRLDANRLVNQICSVQFTSKTMKRRAGKGCAIMAEMFEAIWNADFFDFFMCKAGIVGHPG